MHLKTTWVPFNYMSTLSYVLSNVYKVNSKVLGHHVEGPYTVKNKIYIDKRCFVVI